MSIDDDLPTPRPAGFAPRNLEPLGVGELRAYIAQLQAEIGRAEEEIGRKGSHRGAAEALFRRGE